MPNPKALGLEAYIVDSVDEVGQRRWDNTVNQAEYSTVFQRYGWLKSMEGIPNVEPRHILVEKGSTLIGVFPGFVEKIQNTPLKRYSAMRPGYGGLIILAHEDECFNLYLRKVSEVCRGPVLSHRFLSPEPRYGRYSQPLKNQGYRLDVSNYNFTLDLTKGWSEILGNVKKRRRNHVNNMMKKTDLIEFYPAERSEVRSFYTLFREVIHKVGGHLLSQEFFDNLTQFMSEQVILFGVKENDRFVAAYLKILDEKKKTIRGLFGGVPDLTRHRGYTDLLYIAVINYGMENGYEVLDVGGASASYLNGLYSFKSSWGAVPTALMYWEKGYSPLWWPLKKTYGLFAKPSVY
jgi:hypothetical protein